MDNIVQVNGLRKEYKSDGQTNVALDKISFSLIRGKSLGLIGDNGAGKTTILKIIAGITKPSKGSVKIFGKSNSIIEIGRGFHPELTGRENINLIYNFFGKQKLNYEDFEKKVLDFSELHQFIGLPLKNFSSGMYMRLAFSVNTFLDFDLIIIDEILNVGDFDFIQKCKKRIVELKKSGTSFIFASHDLNQIEEITDETIILSKGKMVSIGNSRIIVDQYLMSKVDNSRNNTKNFDNYFKGIKVYTSNGEVETQKFKTDDEITISIILKVTKSIQFSVGYEVCVLNQNLFGDVEILSPNYSEEIYSPGEYEFKYKIPPNFLFEGNYFINFWLLKSEELISLNIREAYFSVRLSNWLEGKRKIAKKFKPKLKPNFFCEKHKIG